MVVKTRRAEGWPDLLARALAEPLVNVSRTDIQTGSTERLPGKLHFSGIYNVQ